MEVVEKIWSSWFSTSVYSLVVLNVVLLLIQCLIYYRSKPHVRRASLQRHGVRPTDLMDLPPELRALIWTEVVRNERSKTSNLQVSGKTTSRPSILTSATNILTQPFIKASVNSITSLLCTSKLIYSETLQAVCFDDAIKFNIDSDHDNCEGTLFRAPKALLEQVRKAQITLSITPASILPFENMQALEWRNLVASSQWSRKAAIISQINSMTKLTHLHLTVIATGNVHANPVWLWHYVCEALLLPLRQGKMADIKCQISFQIEQMPVLRPNELIKGDFMARKGDTKMGWGFICRNEHDVFGYECSAGVREFARGLVAGCDVEGCAYRELR